MLLSLETSTLAEAFRDEQEFPRERFAAGISCGGERGMARQGWEDSKQFRSRFHQFVQKLGQVSPFLGRM